MCVKLARCSRRGTTKQPISHYRGSNCARHGNERSQPSHKYSWQDFGEDGSRSGGDDGDGSGSGSGGEGGDGSGSGGDGNGWDYVCFIRYRSNLKEFIFYFLFFF